MGKDVKTPVVVEWKPILLNLGCGFKKMDGYINVDKFASCLPDMVLDLNVAPYPWDDNSVDGIKIYHTLEHLQDWYIAFTEIARILKIGSTVEIRVPDESDPNALAYRDHFHVFTRRSFDNVVSGIPRSTTNAEFLEMEVIPLLDVGYAQVPYTRYQWMDKWCRWLLRFCADHFRGFIWEQRFYFEKVEIPEKSLTTASSDVAECS